MLSETKKKFMKNRATTMTSLAHLVGMIYDLKSEVEQRRVNQSLCSSDEKSPINCVTLSGADFQITLDVSAFHPREITVKVKDQEIIVHGEHEERREDEFGFVSRKFTRRYFLPDTFDPLTISSSLNLNGTILLMRISAEKRISSMDGADRFIPIHRN